MPNSCAHVCLLKMHQNSNLVQVEVGLSFKLAATWNQIKAELLKKDSGEG